MVQSADNLSSLRGKLIRRCSHPSLADYDLLEIDVESTAAVDDRPDLLASTVGQPVAVTVPRSLVDDTLQPGVTVTCRVRRTPDGAMASREPGSIQVSDG